MANLIFFVLLASAITVNTTTIALKTVADTDLNALTTEWWFNINNAAVSATNLGYIKIDDEIITYTGVSNTGLTGCVRGALSTTASTHSKYAVVQCYQNNGIPLQE